MLTEWEAIEKRISCRAYRDQRLDVELLRLLSDYTAELNGESGLRFQLITSDGKPTLKLSPAMFDGGVYTYAALVGGDDPVSSEKVGYFGQKLVLYATRLGLGTCWVAGTYDAKSVTAEVFEGEKLWDVIPIGYAAEKIPVKQKMIRAAIRKRDRKLEDFVESEQKFSELPEWVRRGVEAIKLGPSAVNQQPVNIVYQNGRIMAKIRKNGHGLQYNDLGIAKAQFEAGALAQGVRGTWDFGDMGEFHVEPSALS